jgi:hypothetical protein
VFQKLQGVRGNTVKLSLKVCLSNNVDAAHRQGSYKTQRSEISLFPSSGGKIKARDPKPLRPVPDLVSNSGPFTHTIHHTPQQLEERRQKGRLGYRLDNQGIEARFSAEARQFSVLKNA